MASTIGGGNWTLDVSMDRTLVASETGNEPDPEWRFTDPHGHKHRYTARGPERRLVVPTITWEVTETWWCADCCDEHEDGHYVCDECGDEVEPGQRWNPMPLYVAGQRTAELSGWRTDGAHIEAVLMADQMAELERLTVGGFDVEPFMQQLLDTMPTDQIRSVTFAAQPGA